MAAPVDTKISAMGTVLKMQLTDYLTSIRPSDPDESANKKNPPAQVSEIIQSIMLPSKFISDWDASTNTPDLTAAPTKVEGHFYRVSVDGSTNLDGLTVWSVGDEVWFDGTVWRRRNTSSSPKFTGRVVYSVSSVIDIVAANGLTSITDPIMRVQSSTAGDALVTANPQIVSGSEGEYLTVVGNDDTKTVTFTTGNGLKLDNGQNFTLGFNDILELLFVNSLWTEVSRKDNA